MAYTKTNHIITNFSYTDVHGKDSMADIIIAESLDIVMISPLNRKYMYSFEEFNSIVKIVNIILKNFRISPSKAIFFIRTNRFTFRHFEDYMEQNKGEERVFQIIFNNLGTSEDSFIEFAELVPKEINELYSLLKNEGITYLHGGDESRICIDLAFFENEQLLVETEDHVRSRKLRKKIQASKRLPDQYYKVFTLHSNDRIVPKIKSTQGINITLKDYKEASLFHVSFLTAVQAIQIMRKINKIHPLIINDPLVYLWLKEKKCSTEDTDISKDIIKKLTAAELWLQHQDKLPVIMLYY